MLISDILYIWSQSLESTSTPIQEALNPETHLMPYIMSLTAPETIEFSCFYTQRDTSFPAADQTPPSPRTLFVPSLPSSWPEIGDRAACDAAELFWKVINLKKEIAGRDADEDQIESMWPPLEHVDDDEEW
jgi:hypothetical protein